MSHSQVETGNELRPYTFSDLDQVLTWQFSPGCLQTTAARGGRWAGKRLRSSSSQGQIWGTLFSVRDYCSAGPGRILFDNSVTLPGHYINHTYLGYEFIFMVRRWSRTFAWKARGRNAELQPLNRSIVPALFPTDQTFEEFLAWCDHEIAEA